MLRACLAIFTYEVSAAAAAQLLKIDFIQGIVVVDLIIITKLPAG